ncbi:hypothetical protein ACFX13_006139 [Malus domestica]
MMIAATDVNKAVQPAKGDRDLLRIFSWSELRKAFKENDRSALVFSHPLSCPSATQIKLIKIFHLPNIRFLLAQVTICSFRDLASFRA